MFPHTIRTGLSYHISTITALLVPYLCRCPHYPLYPSYHIFCIYVMYLLMLFLSLHVYSAITTDVIIHHSCCFCKSDSSILVKPCLLCNNYKKLYSSLHIYVSTVLIFIHICCIYYVILSTVSCFCCCHINFSSYCCDRVFDPLGVKPLLLIQYSIHLNRQYTVAGTIIHCPILKVVYLFVNPLLYIRVISKFVVLIKLDLY